ncbi:hypothetical protein PTQ19_10410 [Microbacterium esteraromaticum]|uniref:hypothetical protein n=1 Tax=Microbacterium esteraromaticum TaxID=57043 RepID=UPI002367443A|nr:hypothetical protein [Microbacterium esteraromaticum]WDH77934.1 hypothetical protein PTQ19_10410 [Microbacterium esteraromaticum]
MFGNWDRYILADLATFPRIDAYDLDAIDRPWRWLRWQIIALLDIPETRLARALQK